MTGEKKALHKGRRHTRESVQSPLVRTKSKYLLTKVRKGGDFFYGKSGNENYIETVKKTGAQVSGPVPLPTKKEVVTILRAVHKYKDSREQFEQRTHKRLIDIMAPTQKTVDALQRLEMPAGVYIDIKMKNN